MPKIKTIVRPNPVSQKKNEGFKLEFQSNLFLQHFYWHSFFNRVQSNH